MSIAVSPVEKSILEFAYTNIALKQDAFEVLKQTNAIEDSIRTAKSLQKACKTIAGLAVLYALYVLATFTGMSIEVTFKLLLAGIATGVAYAQNSITLQILERELIIKNMQVVPSTDLRLGLIAKSSSLSDNAKQYLMDVKAIRNLFELDFEIARKVL